VSKNVSLLTLARVYDRHFNRQTIARVFLGDGFDALVSSHPCLQHSMRSSPPAASSRPAHGCVPATAIIWGCSTGMLAINLLLSTSAQSEMAIAIAIVVAAAISTMTVWLSTRHAVVTKAEAQDEG
jgi:hypothetical protein